MKYKAWDNFHEKMYDVVALDWGPRLEIITAYVRDEKGVVTKVYPEPVYGDDIIFLPYIHVDTDKGEPIFAGDVLVATREDFHKEGKIVPFKSGYVLDCGNMVLHDFYDYNLRKIGNIYQHPALR